jgi:hypothetical protein
MLFEPPHEEPSDEERLWRFSASPSQLQGGSLGMPTCFSPESAPSTWWTAYAQLDCW